MIKNLKSVIAFLLLFSVSQSLWCQTLYVTLSDSHSNYDNLVKFLEVFESKVEAFKVKNPQGQVVLLINGDYGGASGLASVAIEGKIDAGAIGINALKLIAQSGVQVVFNSGNHEAHDFAPVDGHNQLYVEQMRDLKSAGEKVVLLGTNQNFLPETGLDQLFVKHFDFVDQQNGTNRILGLTLQNLETKSSISPSDKLFSSIEGYEVNLTQHIEKAISDRVSQITVMIHDETPMVVSVAEKLELKYGDRIQFNAWIAGHDHKEARLVTKRGTPILNAGSQFGFMDWEQISARLNLHEVKSFEMDKYSNWQSANRARYTTKLASMIQSVREQVNYEISRVKKSLMSVHHGHFNIIDGKLSMKKARERTELGLALANSMRAWSQSEVRSALPTVGIFNTSSYRVDLSLGSVELTDLHIVEMYPFLTKAKIHKLQSSDLLEVVQKTILFQENINAVQLSSNLRLRTEIREIISHKHGGKIMIEYPVGIEIYDKGWRILESKEYVMAGVDDWTTINGYRNKYESEYLKNHFGSDVMDFKKTKKMDSMLHILQSFLGQELRKAESLNRSALKSVPVRLRHIEKPKPILPLREPPKSSPKSMACKSLFG